MTPEVSVERFQNLSRCYTQTSDLEAGSFPLHVDGLGPFMYFRGEPKKMYHSAQTGRN